MSCFGGTEEQLYLLELLVEKLKIPEERFKDVAVTDSTECTLVVKMKFLDFPVFEISQKDFYFSKVLAPGDDGTRYFSAGRTCLFVKKPRDLVKEMQSTPLKIGIFCAGDTYPLAETEVTLSGCLCNQISMASNDSDHLPPPYILKGGYHLMDSGKNPAGIINLELRLSCFGKSVTTHYQLDKKAFLFKNDREDGQYCVKRVLPLDFCGDEADGKDTMKCGASMLPSLLPDDELEQIPNMMKSEDETTKSEAKKKKNGKNEKNKKSKKKK